MANAKLSENEMAIIRKGLSELEKEAEEVTEREKSVRDEEQKLPWNVDTISQDGFSKSIINKQMPRNELTLHQKLN